MKNVVYKGKKFKTNKEGKLDLSNQEIDDITEIKGLEDFTSLEWLNISDNRITEIKGLDNLVNLKKLSLSQNQITEITGLSSLTNLQELWLYENDINEIKGLDSLINLEFLKINENQITEIKGLENLSSLEWLNISGNQISEIKGLDHLVNLVKLNLGQNQITEIKGLNSLTSLQELWLYENNIAEIKNLGDLSQLKYLSLEKNQITEIRGLEKLTTLERLVLSHNEITEIKGLKNLYNLILLDLRHNKITEISGLKLLSNLAFLYIGGNKILNSLINSLGGLSEDGNAIKPLEFVEYCIKRKAEERVKKEKEIAVEEISPIKTISKNIMDAGHHVFICYSHKDKEIADATCHYLEHNGIKCWIAPRDVSSGAYAGSIVEAIENSKLLVLIFTKNAKFSNHVKREVEIAVKNGITIQPFRTEAVEPTKELEYYISSMHWLDALTRPLEEHLVKLVKMVSQLLEVISTKEN